MGLLQLSTTRGTLAALSLLGSAILPQAAQAQTAAIDFTSSLLGGVSVISTRGYEFNTTSSVTITGLSVFDADALGLAESHDVGLWDASGTLLASLTVPSGTAAPLDSSGKFRYVLLGSPVTLPVATGYRVGAVMIVGTGDELFYNQVGLSSAPGVSYVNGAFANNGINTLSFPSSTFASGFSGGSFVVGSASTAPEPGTLVLVALGVTMGAMAGRRRK